MLLAVFALVSIPVLWSAGAHMTGGWVPDGDDASIARRTMQVFTTDPPLIGHESTADVPVQDQTPNHPGPIGYYVMAIPYAVSGWSPVGLVAGAALVALIGIGTCLAVAERTAGQRGLVAVGLGLALLSVRLGQNWLVRPLNAEMMVFPLVATMLGAWAYLRRDRAGLAVVFIAGSFCLQVSLETLPVVGLVTAACVGLAAYRRWVRHERAPRTRLWWAVVAGLGLMWLPPLLQTVFSWPGNLVIVAHYLLGQTGLIHYASVKDGRLGISPAIGSLLTYATSIPGIDHRGFAGDIEVLVRFSQVAVIPLILGLAMVGFAINWAITRGSAALRSILVVAAGAIVAACLGFAKRPERTLQTQTYFVIWLQAVVAVAWIAAALTLLEFALHLVRRFDADPSRALRRLPLTVGVVLIALLAVVIAPREGPVVRTSAREVTALSAQIRAQVPPGTYLIIGDGFTPWISVSKGVGTDLMAHGYDIRFVDSNEMEDEPRLRGNDEMARLIVTDQLPDVAGPDLVARYDEPKTTFLVRLVPGGQDTNWCADIGALDYRIRKVTGASRDQDPLTPVSTPEMWVKVLAQVKPAEFARARPGSVQSDAGTILALDLVPTIERIKAGAATAPSASQVQALHTLLTTFDQVCSAELVHGAELAPAAGAKRSP